MVLDFETAPHLSSAGCLMLAQKLSEKLAPAFSVAYDCCPVCASRIVAWRTKATPDGHFRIVRCVACGFAFVNPRPALDFVRHFYSARGHDDLTVQSLEGVLSREQRYPNSTIDAKRILGAIDDLLRQNRPGIRKRLLDVGCGYGFFSQQALKQGFEVQAIETASTERTIAEQMTGVKPAPVPFEDYWGPPESFSAILMSQVLEHVFDINEWVEKAHRLLATNGLLAVALPNFSSIFRRILQENEPYICPPAHLNFFDRKSLSTLLAKHGFTVEAIQWVSRLDPGVVWKRLPWLRWCGSSIRLPLRAMVGSFDAMHLSTMINVYARKQKGAR